MDLREWLAAWRFRGVLDLIEQLPRASRYAEAVMNDPEQAVLIAQQREESDREDGPGWSPSWREYGLMGQMMRDLILEVRVLTSTTISAAGGSPGAIKEYPTPVTEVDRAAARLVHEWATDLAGRYGFDAGDL